jgi:cold shock CspA family protein
MCDRIHEEPQTGFVKYFCRSRGHGFIIPTIPNQDNNKSSNVSTESNNKEHNHRQTSESTDSQDIFMHISDIDSEFVPRAGDKVSYRVCPIPPKFEKIQAVNVHILELADSGVPKRWDNPETPEELAEDNNLDNHPGIYDV